MFLGQQWPVLEEGYEEQLRVKEVQKVVKFGLRPQPQGGPPIHLMQL